MIRSTRLLSQAACAAVFCGATLALQAQIANPTSVPAPQGGVVTQNGDIFFYKVDVVRRDIDAVNYFHRSGTTHVGFVGTNLLPEAKGQADVKSERGVINVHAEFKGLRPANSFGPQFLTYVLWAISPDGNPINLGEILPDGSKNNIDVTVPMQAFGMIVTAEPYYAVSTPSDVIVLKNVFDNTQGVLEQVNAHATLLPRGVYQFATNGQNTVENPITRNERSPLELYEAYNAVRIAEDAGAAQYAPEILAKAKTSLQNAADIDASKHRDVKLEITYARGAVQTAADARVVTLRKKAAQRAADQEAAKLQAQQQAAAAAAQAQQSQEQAAQAQAQAAQAQAQALQSQIAQANAQLAAAQAKNQALAAEQAAAAANRRAQSAEAMREKLRAQLNAVLPTTESPRGLVVDLSDVLFATGKYSLKPSTQVSLARVAGILQAYPGLKVQVEGYTDSTGSDDLNQKLSENRANTTRDFLIAQGVSPDSITAAGYGKADPVASNDTAAGRAQNRRVDLVVSGDGIGVQQSAPSAAPAQQ